MATDQQDLEQRMQALETAQAVAAATNAGVQATQAAVTTGMTATNTAMQAGTWSTMLGGAGGFIVGIFLGLAIAAARRA